jgi:arylsulfatase
MPFERSWHESEMYTRWMAENMWLFVPAQTVVREWLETFQEFPPRLGTTLSVDGVVKQLGNPGARQ